MSRITISDISAEQIIEVSEFDAAAVVGGGGFDDLLKLFAGLGASAAKDQLNAIVDLTKYGIASLLKI